MHCYFNFHGLKRGKLFFSFKNLATRFFNLKIAWKIIIVRGNTMYERIRFCETHVSFEIAAFFPLPCSWGKKGGTFKTNMVFTEASPFLYCIVLALRDELKWLMLFRWPWALTVNLEGFFRLVSILRNDHNPRYV